MTTSEVFTIAILVLYFINVLTIFGLIFIERRSYDSLLVWIMILMFLPIIGLFLYGIFGKGPKIGKKKKFLNKIDDDQQYDNLASAQKSVLLSQSDTDSSMSRLALFNLSQKGSIITDNNDVEILRDIEGFYAKMFEDISNAKKYINILFFIIKNDLYGKKLRDLLTEKASEGVKVRLVYDHVGCARLGRRFFGKLKKAGGEVAVFLPSIFQLLNRNVNYRNHRKIVVIDSSIAYTGGANIGKEYTSKHKRITPWHDTHLRIKGDSVNIINLRFMQDFNFATTKPDIVEYKTQPAAGNHVVQILSSGPDAPEESIKLSYIKAIYGAKKRIYIQTPYFIPDESFKVALITAAQSGVDVRIMIPKVPDKKYAYLCTTYYMKELLPHGVKFYLWKGFIHSKTLLVDEDITSIGTFNIDIRSFRLHFEMTTFIYGEEFAAKMQENFENDIKNSTFVPKDYKGPLYKRFLENIMKLFTPLM